jgi:hypothetical protein
MAKKPIYLVGDEEGHVYAPTPNMIYVRERFVDSRYEITHTVEIPERYRNVTFRANERVFVVFEGGKGYVNGKDFRRHISEPSPDANPSDDVSVTATGSWSYGTFTVEDDDEAESPKPKPKPDFSKAHRVSYRLIDRGEVESKGTTADDKGKTLLERWEKDNEQDS